MIYLLEIDVNRRGGVFSRIFSRGMKADYIEVCGVTLCRLSVRSERNIDWLRITGMLDENDLIIIQKGVHIPPDVRLQMPDSEKAQCDMLLEGVTEVVGYTCLAGVKLNILFIDRSAEFTDTVKVLIKCSQQINILTDEHEIYSAYAEKALTDIGAAPIILDDAQSIPDCDIIIAPHGLTGWGALPLPKMIFAPSGSDCVSVCDKCIELPDIFDSPAVDKFDSFALCGAICNCDEYAGEMPRTVRMKWRDRILDINELARTFYA